MAKFWPPSADQDPDNADLVILDPNASITPILLPESFRNTTQIGIEVGSSGFYVVSSRQAEQRRRYLQSHHFTPTEVDKCYDWIREHALQINCLGDGRANRTSPEGEVAQEDIAMITVIGSGAGSFSSRLGENLGCRVRMESEAECVSKGLRFRIDHMPRSIFAYTTDALITVKPATTDRYPCLLVHLGVGVSFLKVEQDGSSERVGGSSMGTGMLTGLLSLLTDAKTYEEMLEKAEQGDHTNVDTLIRDIYGVDYKGIGFRETDIASTFGKLFRLSSQAAQNGDNSIRFSQADISRSLIFAMSNNLGQLSVLYSRTHGLRDIYFAGSYIGGHRFVIRTLQAAVNYWTKGEKQALFLTSDSYLGALGAFCTQPQDTP